MTTTTLLRETYGPRRRLVCAIDGLQQLVWEGDGTSTPPTRAARRSPDVTDLVALEPPDAELSWGIDIAEMDIKPSALTIALRNVEDPTDATTRFFSKLFAPGRHAASTQKSVHLARTSADDPYIDSDATTLAVRGDNSGWSATGYAYTARETLYYGGVAGSSPSCTFTTCVRGLFSCTDLSGTAAWAPTYKVPDYSTSTTEPMGIEISTVPYSWIGRRISLHAVAYDSAIDAWRTDVSGAIDGDLMWIGRIQSIRYNGQRGVWELGCEHILADLEEKICVGMPSNAKLYGINMNGPQGLTCSMYVTDSSLIPLERVDATIAAGVYYGHEQLAQELQNKLDKFSKIRLYFSFDGEKVGISVHNLSGQDAQVWINREFNHAYNVPTSQDPLYRCHALNALGFGFGDGETRIDFGTIPDGKTASVYASGPPAVAYHPISRSVNGTRVHCSVVNTSDKAFIYDATMNDYGANSATVEVENAKFGYKKQDEKKTYHVRYNAITTQNFANSTGSAGTLTILADPVLDLPYANWAHHSYAAQWLGDEPTIVRNVYCPHYYTSGGRARGPFELLLYSLLSTGTTDANDSTYDKLPLECGAAMDADIVDLTAFLDADIDIGGGELAQRREYVIGEGISWMDLLKRECKLFGYVLAWDNSVGKLSLRSVYGHALDTYTETISDSTGIDPEEFPDADMSDATVINRWEMSIVYDRALAKYAAPIVVEDEDSIQMLRTAKTVSVKHPGVWLKTGVISGVEEIVRQIFLQSRQCWRYPWLVVTKTLAPYLANRISIGDMVLFTSDRMPDPYGGGTMSTSAMALVTNLSWNLRDWSGKATLLLYSGYDAALVTPWAWSAVTSSWDAVNLRLTVAAKTWGATADSDDAAEAEDGDFVDIIERAPADPTAPQSWTDLELASDYETDGANILTFVGGTELRGWVATKEYIVIPSVYSSAVTAQKTENAFIADYHTFLLGTDPAHRYG